MSIHLPDDLIDRLIAEDVPYGDLTTRALGIGDLPGRMTFSARHSLVLCGAQVAARIIQKLGGSVSHVLADGRTVPAGTVVLEASGAAQCLHAAWKSAQTLMEWTSGIATAVAEIRLAAQAVSPQIRIACARKAPPGTRALAVMAVQAGGGEMHRTGLSETVLIFPEHLTFLGADSIAAAVARAKSHALERTVVIEVNSEEDAVIAADSGAGVVQLEKFPPDAVRRVVDRIGGKCLVAAAGGVKSGNAAAYAQAGANDLVTSAPYSGIPAEIQVVIQSV